MKKERGRPATLTDAQREERRVDLNKKRNETHKGSGYAAQKKYLSRGDIYPARFFVKRPVIDEIVAKTGMTPTEIFIDAVEEKYGVILRDIDKTAKD